MVTGHLSFSCGWVPKYYQFVNSIVVDHSFEFGDSSDLVDFSEFAELTDWIEFFDMDVSIDMIEFVVYPPRTSISNMPLSNTYLDIYLFSISNTRHPSDI